MQTLKILKESSKSLRIVIDSSTQFFKNCLKTLKKGVMTLHFFCGTTTSQMPSILLIIAILRRFVPTILSIMLNFREKISEILKIWRTEQSDNLHYWSDIFMKIKRICFFKYIGFIHHTV